MLVQFILLINVKIPTIAGILTFYYQIENILYNIWVS